MDQVQQGCLPLFFMGFNGKCHRFIKFVNISEAKVGQGERQHTHRKFLDVKPSNLQQYSRCNQNGAIPCGFWNSECFTIDQICSFSLDKNKSIVPCSNAEHMAYCKHFQCNAMYKCPDYYCIPWTYVCDGKIDCPYGPDETIKCCRDKWPNCYRMFKCSAVKRCVHLRNVCDGLVDCIDGEDEILCQLLSLQCPKNCHCLAMAIHCEGGNTIPSDFNHPVSYPTISLSMCFLEVKDLPIILCKFQSILFLKINKASLKRFESKFVPPGMLSVNLAMNALSKLSQVSFSFLFDLIILSLQSNMIVTIQTKSFEHLGSLKQLNLSNNLFVSLPEILFNSSVHVKLFLIQNMELSVQSSKLIHMIQISVLDVTDFHLCCGISPNSFCTAARNKIWYASCLGILPNLATKTALPVLSFLSF